MGWIVWDKGQKLTMSDGELIYTSFSRALRIVTVHRTKICKYGGYLHPTQKPVELYYWILSRYARPGIKYWIRIWEVGRAVWPHMLWGWTSGDAKRTASILNHRKIAS